MTLSVHDGVRFSLNDTWINDEVRQDWSPLPVFIYMAQLILVAALEFPKFTFFKPNENIAFPPLNKQLVILL